jgi:hypothetical protein
MKLTLHIGLKKTATTTLQKALWDARQHLASEGVLFPGLSADHQRLARTVRSAAAGVAGKAAKAEATLELLAAEMRQQPFRHMVLSSEHFSGFSDGAVQRLQGLLEARLPEITEIAVLCYLREPIAFASSMCQQELKNGTIRLADFEANPWPFALAERLMAYRDSFGPAAINLRYFHPGHLKDGDILRDFLAAIGLPDLDISAAGARRNPSLSQDGALVADALAALRPGPSRRTKLRRAYRRMLEKIEGPRFRLSEPVQERVIAASHADLALIRETFGLEIVPEPVPGPTETALTPAAAQSMAKTIAAIVEA